MSPTRTVQYFLVDAFADAPSRGNPAGVVILSNPLSDEEMQTIARGLHALHPSAHTSHHAHSEVKLSKTAFAVRKSDSATVTAYSLRWFTPVAEESFCGHATLVTLATSHILLTQEEVQRNLSFSTLSGVLTAERLLNGYIELNLPADDFVEVGSEYVAFKTYTEAVSEAFEGKATLKRAVQGRLDVLLELELADNVHLADVDIIESALAPILTPRTVILTTLLSTDLQGTQPHVHSRVLPLADKLPEDPVTGSAHCTIVPFFVPRLIAAAGSHLEMEEVELRATQGSAKRRGDLRAVWDGKSGKEGGRVKLRGKAFTVAGGDFILNA
ncbi:Diaminopimelate epimerase-like protein [Punctularia strigosozonata HHB-11173 SS5]|uniref:Diaminopimelate epimerase-like protein n=1 Tax=Punctularia strigosozonata (strain HHB-11173) TaxID=741275 RepID=UPI0004417872|nr:Diaminopimelate epimerase-like protein [Punctularia strigosozonata HHB-11173 SS5]EIN11560.1 Diaminopimelate epimerase-like protein [Punctularia strigosozonata HHB-11173 SS5]